MKPHNPPKPWIALPVLDEGMVLPAFLDSLRNQEYRDFTLVVCVNQPEHWWEMAEKKAACERNVQVLNELAEIRDMDLILIDKCTPGNGWEKQKHGVGWARKTLMDRINQLADDNGIIISLDADTVFNPGYIGSVIDTFQHYPQASCLSVQYYHRLVEDEKASRAMLRYEIYMRNYSLNLWRIGCPYSFTALGSAIALPVRAYRRIGGMTPKKSGEDFYFLQKLRKAGDMVCWNPEKVYPGTRFSDRVYFGTGPAMIKGSRGEWDSYPVYHHLLFDEILETYALFETLFERTVPTPMDGFLKEIFREEDIWDPIRKNCKTAGQFIKAAHQKVDALRILQYLKSRQQETGFGDEESLVSLFERFYPGNGLENILEDLDFTCLSVEDLNRIRDFLVEKEEAIQKDAILANPWSYERRQKT